MLVLPELDVPFRMMMVPLLIAARFYRERLPGGSLLRAECPLEGADELALG